MAINNNWWFRRFIEIIHIQTWNAEKTNTAIDNLEDTETNFQIKELVRLGIVKELNNMYKFEGQPVGVGVRGISEAFITTPDLKVQMLKALEEAKK